MLRYFTKIKNFLQNSTNSKYITAAVVVAMCVAVFATMSLTKLPEPVYEPSPTVEATPTPASTMGSVLALPDTPAEETPSPTPEPPMVILPHLEPLYAKNNDLAGWLKIEDTEIDYPVMYTPDDPGFYLYRTFEKEEDPTEQGTLFIDENCTLEPRSANLIIHGHNMKGGTMFGNLDAYKKESYFKQHPTFEFSTLYETNEYEIVSVFLSKIYRRSDEVFKFYQFYDAQTEDEFDYFIDNIKKLQLYETGVTASFGDKLVTLSTCEYSQENGRLVVVGRHVVERE